MTDDTCKDHTGCLRDIVNLEKENTAQWASIRCLDLKYNNILTRLNTILGGVVVACVLLAINILVTKIG